MKYNNLKGSLILITAAIIWGFAFVAQSGAASLVPPFTVNALRSFIAAAALYIFYRISGMKNPEPFFPKDSKIKKSYFAGGVSCGICLAISVNLQQFGIAAYPENAAAEARTGFITTLYIIFVPLISAFFGKKIRPVIWVSVLAATVGFYLLCFSGGASGIYLGDMFVLLCAITFSFHIMAIDKYVSVTGGIKLSVMQLFLCGVISSVLAIVFESDELTLSAVLSAALPILYLGIMSSGVAYTLQIVGQSFAEPTVASISMSMESVFAALGGWLFSGATLTAREIAGCALVFAATIAAQLPAPNKNTANT